MKMLDPFQTRMAIEVLAVGFWHEVDFNAGSLAHEYFTTDGVFTTSSGSRYAGHAAIRKFYEDLLGSAEGRTRHAVMNLHVVQAGSDRVTAKSLLVLHALEAQSVQTSRPATLLADVVDVCVCDAEGRWRYSSREILPLARA